MNTTGETLAITRARFAEIDLDRMAAVRSKALGVLVGNTGLMSLTLWERHDDPFSFMTMGHFATEEDSLQAWDKLVRSPVMDVMTELMTEPPNVQLFNLTSHTGKSLENTAPGTFCSFSTRIADIGYGPTMTEEMNGIFEELKVLPGFLGGITGQLNEVSDEILGLMLWSTKSAYEASLPATVTFRIDLYQRVL